MQNPHHLHPPHHHRYGAISWVPSVRLTYVSPTIIRSENKDYTRGQFETTEAHLAPCYTKYFKDRFALVGDDTLRVRRGGETPLWPHWCRHLSRVNESTVINYTLLRRVVELGFPFPSLCSEHLEVCPSITAQQPLPSGDAECTCVSAIAAVTPASVITCIPRSWAGPLPQGKAGN